MVISGTLTMKKYIYYFKKPASKELVFGFAITIIILKLQMLSFNDSLNLDCGYPGSLPLLKEAAAKQGWSLKT